MAADATGAYVVDYGRQKLVQLPALPAAVTACKLEDIDGDPNTTNDREPVKNFPLTLITGGVPSETTQLTGDDGCTTWQELVLGTEYGVKEELPEGWKALGPTKKEFGAAVTGASYRYTFVNTQETDWYVYLPLVIK